ncbi:tetratricopeptide repeat-containing protein [Bradyrhizobium sp. 2TAF36]|uniref:tetratricopeptide repeat-containing protein n=1 Tax=Bradyrhizobium sp. 2TAF36 TaxID=3233016 RepID=UPI003F91D3C1
MTSASRAFVIMPFGKKKGLDGNEIDFDAVYSLLLSPAISAVGLTPHRADADRRGGSIHSDMFQDLLLAEFVVADLTLDNPNVWYEIGVRHALRGTGTIMTYALRERLPFDIAGQRMQRYTLSGSKPDPATLEADRNGLTDAIRQTLEAWEGRRSSPVYQQLPYLREPNWKTLRVGGINEYWDSLQRWQARIEIARRKQRPGDILVLADETPNSLLEFEALCTAADALIRLQKPRFALKILERARKLDPVDIRARQLEGRALGRAERYTEAREALTQLASESKDGESLGICARTWKDEWLQGWNAHPLRKTNPTTAARATAAALHSAASAYYEAFRSVPGEFYSGINALTLGRVWEHVTEEESTLPLELIDDGVRWSLAAGINANRTYWSLVSSGELAVVHNRKREAISYYSEGAALAVANGDRFALDASSQQLDFLRALMYRPSIVGELAKVLDAAEKELDTRIGSRALDQSQPQHIVLFSGHMIDDPSARGPGAERSARFPDAKVNAVAARIEDCLNRIGAGRGDLGLSGGASGGDLLFAEACLKRGMSLEIRLSAAEPEFLAESVTFADPDHFWEESFARVKSHPATTLLYMPEELGLAPKNIGKYDRCNRWLLYTALSQGLSKVSFVTLWNGQPGDGPGGTQDMIDLVRKFTGQQPWIINPATL